MKTIPKITHIIAVLMLILLAGCMKSEFTLKFRFPKDHVGNYMLNYYAWDSRRGAWVENVASVQNGVAEVKCATSRPTLVYIRDASSASNSMAVYAERGDEIIISGDNTDMNTWTVKGNKTSERWNQWRKKNAAVLSKDRDRFTADKEKAIAEFVNANKSDRLSALLLLTEWDRRANAEGFLKLWNAIDEDARSQRLIEMCGSTDLLGVEFEVDAKGKLTRKKSAKTDEIVLRSRFNGIDTLRLKKAKSALLYFYSENNSNRTETVDSIRILSAEYPDSARRIISIIALQPDSMVWLNAARRDTVKNVVNAWVPHGLADKNMVSLGVARIPWYIVTGKEGKEIYAGDDLKEAVAAFRKDMEIKEKKEKAGSPQGQTHNAKR